MSEVNSQDHEVSAGKYFVRESDVAGFAPDNHVGTVNKRLIVPETVGARHMEVIVGIVGGDGTGGGSLPHRHSHVEQANYVLEGRAKVEVAGHVAELGPGDMCFFPANTDHAVTRISNEPLKVLVIYSPPLSSAGA